MSKLPNTRFAPGETIIREGEAADFVYTLNSGYAEAHQGGVKVGEICPGEIFGALAAFTGVSRNASVIARTICRVEAIHKDDFILLVRRQPDLCVKLIQDMARLIGDLNETVRILSTPVGLTPVPQSPPPDPS